MTTDYTDPEALRQVGRAVAQELLEHMGATPVTNPDSLKKALIAALLEHKRIAPFIAAMGAGQVYKILDDTLDPDDLSSPD